MDRKTDKELLRAYALDNSEEAFAELVNRHVHLVSSTALRLLVDAHLAEDATQGTFVALARNARKLAGREIISSWLYLTARNVAAKTVRLEERRRGREREAVAMETQTPTPEYLWKQVAPHLDEMISCLSEKDRDALVLRFFERKSAREMGLALGISDETAQKRVTRAIGRLRELLSKRGVAAGAGALAVCLSTQAVQAAPACFTSTLSTAALAAATAAGEATTATIGKVLVMTTMQKTVITATLVIVTGACVYEAHRASSLHSKTRTLELEQAGLKEQIQGLRQERDEAAARLASLADERDRWRFNENELLELRGQIALLRQDSEQLKALRGLKSTDQQAAAMVAWLDRVQRLKQRLAQSPDASIPELASLTEQDWLEATGNELNSDSEYRRALSRLRSLAEYHYLQAIRDAVAEYTKANPDKWPNDIAQVEPYFKTPIEDAIIQRYEIAPAGTLPMLTPMSGWVVTQKAPVDPEYDTRLMLGPDGLSNLHFQDSEMFRMLTPAIQAYFTANSNETPQDANPTRFAPYVRTAEEQAALSLAAQQYESASPARRTQILNIVRGLVAR